MKRMVFIILALCILAGQSNGDVKRRQQSQIEFTGFGTYTTEETAKITEGISRTDSRSQFKGANITAKIVGKFLKQGETGEIFNLMEMMHYSIDHKKKQYMVKAIEKISIPTAETPPHRDHAEEMKEEEGNKSKDNIRIVRSEFRVDRTMEKMDLNGFPCEKFVLLALTEWEDIESGDTGIDSLSTIIWMTPFSEELRKIQDEESTFNKAHLAAMGIDRDQIYKDILGSDWLSIFGKMNKEEKGEEERESEKPDPKLMEEMNKLEGYPVLIDGKFFIIRPQSEENEAQKEEEKTDITDVKKSAGRFAKGLFKKKEEEPEGLKPAFSYRTELLEYRLTQFNEDELKVNPKYKRK